MRFVSLESLKETYKEIEKEKDIALLKFRNSPFASVKSEYYGTRYELLEYELLILSYLITNYKPLKE